MNFKRLCRSAELNLKKAAPDICLVTGLVLSGVAMVEFCKKTIEAKPTFDEFKEEMVVLKEANKDEETAPFARDKAIALTKKAGVKLVKAYWKPVLLWSASTGLIIKSHTILKDRNVALTALATGLGAELRTLHQRIIERYGEQVDHELKHGIKYETVDETRIDEATGSEVVDQKQIPVCDDSATGGTSIYARYFDDSSRLWVNDAETNLITLKGLEHDCNQILQDEGILFLNDVYRKLDMKPTKAGQKVGWRYFRNKEDNIYGDNYISFGIHNVHRRGNRDFVNGYESAILLDFNVDGAVIDALPLR